MPSDPWSDKLPAGATYRYPTYGFTVGLLQTFPSLERVILESLPPHATNATVSRRLDDLIARQERQTPHLSRPHAPTISLPRLVWVLFVTEAEAAAEDPVVASVLERLRSAQGKTFATESAAREALLLSTLPAWDRVLEKSTRFRRAIWEQHRRPSWQSLSRSVSNPKSQYSRKGEHLIPEWSLKKRTEFFKGQGLAPSFPTSLRKLDVWSIVFIPLVAHLTPLLRETHRKAAAEASCLVHARYPHLWDHNEGIVRDRVRSAAPWPRILERWASCRVERAFLYEIPRGRWFTSQEMSRLTGIPTSDRDGNPRVRPYLDRFVWSKETKEKETEKGEQVAKEKLERHPVKSQYRCLLPPE